MRLEWPAVQQLWRYLLPREHRGSEPEWNLAASCLTQPATTAAHGRGPKGSTPRPSTKAGLGTCVPTGDPTRSLRLLCAAPCMHSATAIARTTGLIFLGASESGQTSSSPHEKLQFSLMAAFGMFALSTGVNPRLTSGTGLLSFAGTSRETVSQTGHLKQQAGKSYVSGSTFPSPRLFKP